MPDAGGLDTEGTEAGGGASAEAGGEAPAEPASPDSGVVPEAPAAPPATLIVLPDTQYYASSYPDVFAGQTNWILAQQLPLNIAAVLHVGDIVDGDTQSQWNVAGTSMHSLDGKVPYVVVPGNHDTNISRVTMMDSYFGPASMPWISGTMTAGQMENNYALVDVGPQQWLVIAVEFGPRNAVVAWADKVLKAYPTTPAILLTHAYLYSDGTRYNLAVGGTDSSKEDLFQWWYPQYYGFTPAEGINDGEMLWQKLVLPNSNVRLVFCGHQTGWARLTSTRPDGTSVHQVLSDYQWLDGKNFGFGYLRVLQLDYAKKTVAVQTYSPYLNVYLTDDANQFTLDL